MNNESEEQMAERMVAEGIPNIKSHKDAVKIVTMLSEVLEERFSDRDKEEHLYKYAIAAICSAAHHIQRCVNKGPLDNEDILHIVIAAFGLGRLRGSYKNGTGSLGILEGFKEKCMAEFGAMTKEELLRGSKSNPGPFSIEEVLDMINKGSAEVKVISLSDLLKELRRN